MVPETKHNANVVTIDVIDVETNNYNDKGAQTEPVSKWLDQYVTGRMRKCGSAVVQKELLRQISVQRLLVLQKENKELREMHAEWTEKLSSYSSPLQPNVDIKEEEIRNEGPSEPYLESAANTINERSTKEIKVCKIEGHFTTRWTPEPDTSGDSDGLISSGDSDGLISPHVETKHNTSSFLLQHPIITADINETTPQLKPYDINETTPQLKPYVSLPEYALQKINYSEEPRAILPNNRSTMYEHTGHPVGANVFFNHAVGMNNRAQQPVQHRDSIQYPISVHEKSSAVPNFENFLQIMHQHQLQQQQQQQLQQEQRQQQLQQQVYSVNYARTMEFMSMNGPSNKLQEDALQRNLHYRNMQQLAEYARISGSEVNIQNKMYSAEQYFTPTDYYTTPPPLPMAPYVNNSNNNNYYTNTNRVFPVPRSSKYLFRHSPY